MDLRVSKSVVEKTQGKGKVGENWASRVALGGECPWHGLADKGAPAPEKPLD
jgi:hypothetical protein